MEKYSVAISFREPKKRTLEDINNIIFNIPGTLKEGHNQEAMSVMIHGDSYVLPYETKENADKVANAIFQGFSKDVDVRKMY